MKKLFYFAAVAAAVLTSCAKTHDTHQYTGAGDAVSFSVYAGKAATKAVSATDPYGNIVTATLESSTSGFGVFGYYTGNANYASGSFSANFMYNQQVTCDGTKWEYHPVKYWPNEHGNQAVSTDTDKLTFMAYAPWVEINTLNTDTPSTVNDGSDNDATEGIISMTGNAVEGDAKLSFVVPSASDEQIDLLYGVLKTASTNVQGGTDGVANGAIKDLTKQECDGKVSILFKHALAKVQLDVLDVVDKVDPTSSVNPSADGTKVFVNSINILGSGLGTSGKLNLYDGTWSNTAGTSSYSVSPLPACIYQAAAPANKTALDAISETGVVEGGLAAADKPAIMFVPAGTITGIEIVYYVCTADTNLATGVSVVENHITKTFSPSAITVAAGTQYNITIRLGLTSIDFTVDVADWGTEAHAIDLPQNVA